MHNQRVKTNTRATGTVYTALTAQTHKLATWTFQNYCLITRFNTSTCDSNHIWLEQLNENRNLDSRTFAKIDLTSQAYGYERPYVCSLEVSHSHRAHKTHLGRDSTFQLKQEIISTVLKSSFAIYSNRNNGAMINDA